jgi:hypothetical protein
MQTSGCHRILNMLDTGVPAQVPERVRNLVGASIEKEIAAAARQEIVTGDPSIVTYDL